MFTDSYLPPDLILWITEQQERLERERSTSAVSTSAEAITGQSDSVAAGAVGQSSGPPQEHGDPHLPQSGVHRSSQDPLRRQQGKSTRRSARAGRRQVSASGSGSSRSR